MDLTRTKMVRAVARRRNIDYPEQSAEGIIIKTVGSQEVFVLVITCTGPEVSDLLGTDLGVHRVRWALQRRSRNLENGQRWSVLGKRLSDTRDTGDQGW